VEAGKSKVKMPASGLVFTCQNVGGQRGKRELKYPFYKASISLIRAVPSRPYYFPKVLSPNFAAKATKFQQKLGREQYPNLSNCFFALFL
jgi:hypothetical protein